MDIESWRAACLNDRHISEKIVVLCEDIGILPLRNPCGDGNHTDEPLRDEDVKVAEVVSHFVGDLFVDFHTMSPLEQWQVVARALRVHGLKISNR